ncbi:MAG: hypothetical protein V4466_09875 [Pseudomonadota bacterium]
MTRLIALIAAAALAASPTAGLAQTVPSEAPPEDAGQSPASGPASLAEPVREKVAEGASEPAASPAIAGIDPSVYQVLRTGDRQMSCEALGAEANTLNAEVAAERQEAAKKAKKAKAGKGLMGGVAGGVLGGAARYGLARGMVGGAFSPLIAQAAVVVTDSTAQAAGQAIANSGDDSDLQTVSPKQQRMDHLLGLYREKQC